MSVTRSSVLGTRAVAPCARLSVSLAATSGSSLTEVTLTVCCRVLEVPPSPSVSTKSMVRGVVDGDSEVLL